MINEYFANLARLVLFTLIQGVILQRVGATSGVEVLLYPVAVIMMPVRTPTWALLLIAFAVGLIVDLFYVTLGVHTAALLTTAFLRPLVARAMEPRGGYSPEDAITKRRMGTAWLSQYAGILLGVHCTLYFLLEAFTLNGLVILRILSSGVLSFLMFFLYQHLFNPRY